MRWIDADRLKSRLFSTFTDDLERRIIENAIDSQPAAEPPNKVCDNCDLLHYGEWIPCIQEYPEKNKKVLIAIREEEDPIMAQYQPEEDSRGYDWFIDDNSDYLHVSEVLAWQPLPEPYKGD